MTNVSWRGPNSAQGWTSFLTWLTAFDLPHQVGIEGAWSYGRGLAQFLVEREITVYEVNSRWTALGRRGARKTDKSDRLDARAVAMFVRQEASGLTPIARDDETAVLNLLCTEREDAVVESTKLRNQLHAVLLQLDPGYDLYLGSLKSKSGLSALLGFEVDEPTPLAKHRVDSVHRLARRLELVLAQVAELDAQIRDLVGSRFTPLTDLCGVNVLTAATLAGILGPGRRFESDAALGVVRRSGSTRGFFSRATDFSSGVIDSHRYV